MKTLIIAILFAVLQVQAAEWPSVETKEGAKQFIQNHCFGTRYILLDNGTGNLFHEKTYPPSPLPASNGVIYPDGHEGRDYYAVRIVFAVSKGYGYSVGPFSGNMAIVVTGSQAGTWQIGLDGGFPGPEGRWR